MPPYSRGRTGFRLVAAIAALTLLGMGAAIIVIGVRVVGRRELAGLLGVVVGIAVTALGVVLGKDVWTAHAPAPLGERERDVAGTPVVPGDAPSRGGRND